MSNLAQDALAPLTFEELDSVLAALDPRIIAGIVRTYARDSIEPGLSFALLRSEMIEWGNHRGGFGAALLAELEVLVPLHVAKVRREVAARCATLFPTRIIGPRPIDIHFARGGATVHLWCSLVGLTGPDGQRSTFLLASVSGLEGRPGQPDDPPELLGVAGRVSLAGDHLDLAHAEIDRVSDLAALAIPASLEAELLTLTASVDHVDSLSSDMVVGWVRAPEDHSAVWCHGLVSEPHLTPVIQSGHAVTPLFGVDSVHYRLELNGTETLDVSEGRLRGFASAGHVLELASVASLISRALLRRTPWPRRISWAVRRLFLGRPDARSSPSTSALASGELRLIDWLYTERHSFDATQFVDLVALLVVLHVAALATYLGSAFLLSQLLDLPYGLDDFEHQVRMGFGVLAIAGIGIPALYGARAGVLATWSATLVGASTIGISGLLNVPSTVAVASASAGALFGAVLFLGGDDERSPRGAIDVRRLFRLITTVAAAGLLCAAGYALTQWHFFRAQPVPIAFGLAFFVMLLIAPVLLRLVRRLANRRVLRALVPVYFAIAASLVALIWIGIAWASDATLSGLLEGGAFAGLASLILLLVAPHLRSASLAMYRIFWGLCFPLCVIASYWLILAEHRRVIASLAFCGGLLGGAIAAWLLFGLSRALLRTLRKWR